MCLRKLSLILLFLLSEFPLAALESGGIPTQSSQSPRQKALELLDNLDNNELMQLQSSGQLVELLKTQEKSLQGLDSSLKSTSQMLQLTEVIAGASLLALAIETVVLIVRR
jgi:hypothetical protein